MRRIIVFFIAVVSCEAIAGQEKFVFEGKIEYERKINVHRQLNTSDNSDWYQDFVKKSPPFHTSLFSLHFKGSQTLFKPAGEIPKTEMIFLLGPAKENVVYNDLNTHLRKSYKAIFEKNYVLNDTVQRMLWRITDEKRTIAGMECRKAVTIICDSVYVVAFYTDEIPVSGGPESFSGLPGMILGLAIPRLHTTWFATRVTMVPPATKDLEFVARGQSTTRSKLLSTLNSTFDDWGDHRNRNLWWIML